MRKQFDTLAVASAATGIALAEGLNYALMAEISAFVMGFPVWTHELGDKVMTERVSAAIYLQLPSLPSREAARADWRAAAAVARRAYGAMVEIQEGGEQRTEGPIESLERMIAGKGQQR